MHARQARGKGSKFELIQEKTGWKSVFWMASLPRNVCAFSRLFCILDDPLGILAQHWKAIIFNCWPFHNSGTSVFLLIRLFAWRTKVASGLKQSSSRHRVGLVLSHVRVNMLKVNTTLDDRSRRWQISRLSQISLHLSLTQNGLTTSWSTPHPRRQCDLDSESSPLLDGRCSAIRHRTLHPFSGQPSTPLEYVEETANLLKLIITVVVTEHTVIMCGVHTHTVGDPLGNGSASWDHVSSSGE